MKRTLLILLVLITGCEKSLEETIHGTRGEIKTALRKNGAITDSQTEILIRDRTSVRLFGLTSITDEQAEILSKVIRLELPDLASITDKQAESLSKVFFSLSLPALTSITNAQAESLSKVEHLSLDGLYSITDEQAETLSEVAVLSLRGLTSITDAQAETLSKLETLGLPNLTSITDKQAESLSKVEHLYLDGLTSITDEQAESLSKFDHLELRGLTSITDKQAESLSKVEHLSLPGLTSLTDEQAESLSKVNHLDLNGLTSITDEQARSLSRNYVWSTRSVRDLIELHSDPIQRALSDNSPSVTSKVNQEASTPVVLPESADSIGMEFKLIPAGTFTMGAGDDAHEVTLTKPFKMGVHEVTQAQYEQVMGVNRSSFKGADNPVQKVSWTDAVEFCRRLSELPAEKAAGHVYRLPSETEWEYACRAGTSTKYSFGDDESEFGTYGWYSDNSGKKTHPVGSKQPNAWGLYDMHGNVWEWCQDWYGDHPSGSVTDPGGAASGSHHVLRGGSWFDLAGVCRSSDRLMGWPSNRHDDFGFRVVLSQP